MTSKIRSLRVSPSMIVSCVALFLALTGSALAVGLAKNSVHSAQIADGAVRTVDLHRNAVKTPTIAPAAVGKEQLAENSVDSSKVEDESLTAQDLGTASVASSEVVDQSLTAADLGPGSVGSSELQSGAVVASKLGAISVRSNSTKVANGANGTVSVSCLAGERVLSGGCQPGHFGTEMTTNKPSGNGWLYQAKNASGSEDTITVYALCLAG